MRSLILAILVVLAGSAYGQLDGEPRREPAPRIRPVSTPSKRSRTSRPRRRGPRLLRDMSRRSLRHKVFADVDGDGRRDLVRVHRVDYRNVDDADDDEVLPATIELNTEHGFLPPREITASYLTPTAPRVEVIDLNRDGRDDLILIDNDERNPIDRVWLSDGRGYYDPGLTPAVCALSRARARDLRGCRSRTSSRL